VSAAKRSFILKSFPRSPANRLVVGNLVHPGSAFNIDPKRSMPARSPITPVRQKAQNITDFLVHIIPNTIVDAFSKGDILQVLLISVLFGFALSIAGPRCKPLLDVMDSLTRAVFGVVAILMRFAPIGAFGAMAFTIGKYGLASLGPLVKLIATLYLTSLFFVLVVLGLIARIAGFGILKFLWFIREEILLVLATSFFRACPAESLWTSSKSWAVQKRWSGLVVPTGYTFNADGTSLYMTLAALFVAQATGTHLTLFSNSPSSVSRCLPPKAPASPKGPPSSPWSLR